MESSDVLLILDKHLYIVLFFLVLLVEAGLPIPIPYDILILFSGYRNLSLVNVTFAVVAGNVIGSSVLYFLSLRFGRPFISPGTFIFPKGKEEFYGKI